MKPRCRAIKPLGLTFVLLVSTGVLRAQDLVLQWNEAALTAIRTAGTPPTAASRNLALVHCAIHDAVNGVKPRYQHALVAPLSLKQTSEEAAGSTAAHDILVALYPTQAATFDALHTKILATIHDGKQKTNGIAWGKHVASDTLTARASDGAANTEPYPGSTEPGKWRPHLSFGNIVRPALHAHWGKVKPFCLLAGSQFFPPAPPALPTWSYAVEVIITQSYGAATGSLRTPEQTEIAKFWSYGPNTSTPPGHWNQIAQAVARNGKDKLYEHARLFALLNMAMADAAIASWDCKYKVGLWRPITAIQLADQDGNPNTVADPSWKPLLDTPPFPEYTSGHSTFSGAAAAILERYYKTDNVSFTVGSDDLPTVTRQYSSFSQAALESGLSRVLGGIHFFSANLQGLSGGYQCGAFAWENGLLPLK